MPVLSEVQRTTIADLSFRAQFRHPLVGCRNEVEEPAVPLRAAETGPSTRPMIRDANPRTWSG